MSRLSCSALAATLRGIEAVPVQVEVVIGPGIPSFSIVGMPDVAIQESRERVKAAIRASGFRFPADKIVVNLAPGSLRKHGSGFDLPIALCILCATDQVPRRVLDGCVCMGELSLDGSVTSVQGLLPVQLKAKSLGRHVLTGSLAERYVPVPGVACWSLRRLEDAAAGLGDASPLASSGLAAAGGEASFGVGGATCDDLDSGSPHATSMPDFAQVHGQEAAKRALQVAAVGRHDVLMVGPPGSGKTFLASCLPGILPPLNEAAAMESAAVHSVAGVDVDGILQGRRPFRAPHHSATQAGLIGGGSPVRPGEASLAHNGVLFLDELSEFQPRVLQTLRQPLESGKVRITRVDGTYELPTDFLLVAATNPCPCGHYGDRRKPCRCSPSQVHAYQNRIGGPLYDRIDIRIDVQRPDPAKLMGVKVPGGPAQRCPASTVELASGVRRAIEFRKGRLAGSAAGLGIAGNGKRVARASEPKASAAKDGLGNASMEAASRILTAAPGHVDGSQSFGDALFACGLDKPASEFFLALMQQHAMSARSGMKTLRLARTVADLELSEHVHEGHLAQACSMRFANGMEG